MRRSLFPGADAVEQVHADGLPNNIRQISGQRLAVDRKRVEIANQELQR